jgi:hypothetical protein
MDDPPPFRSVRLSLTATSGVNPTAGQRQFAAASRWPPTACRLHTRKKASAPSAGHMPMADSFLGWPRGEPDHCGMTAIHTLAEEEPLA